MTRLIVNENDIRAFADGVFRYASDGQFDIDPYFFDDGGGPDAAIQAVRINGEVLEPVIQAAAAQAQFAADHSKRAVFCPPLAAFRTATAATEADVSEAFVLSGSNATNTRKKPANGLKRCSARPPSWWRVAAHGPTWQQERCRKGFICTGG